MAVAFGRYRELSLCYTPGYLGANCEPCIKRCPSFNNFESRVPLSYFLKAYPFETCKMIIKCAPITNIPTRWKLAVQKKV